ncbi:MAG: hypothetical protein ACYTXA_07635 [Nostoc sp.]
MPHTSLREAAPTATLLRRRSVQVSTSAQCPISNTYLLLTFVRFSSWLL